MAKKNCKRAAIECICARHKISTHIAADVIVIIIIVVVVAVSLSVFVVVTQLKRRQIYGSTFRRHFTGDIVSLAIRHLDVIIFELNGFGERKCKTVFTEIHISR